MDFVNIILLSVSIAIKNSSFIIEPSKNAANIDGVFCLPLDSV